MLLALKLISVPGMLGAASLAARRWGPSVAGWLSALPLTSGLVLLFLTMEQGRFFAVAAANGSLLGLVPLCSFYLGYAAAARRFPWYVCLVVGLLGCVSLTAAFNTFAPETLVSLALGLSAITFTYLVIPHPALSDAPPRPSLFWEIPVRMAVACGVVLFITGAADRLGPHLAGLLTSFPASSGVLAPFIHREMGAGGAIRILRGVAIGLTSFATFFATVALLLPLASLSIAFTIAAVATLAVHALILKTVIARVGTQG
jgi:hypothetical protein